MTNKNEQKRKKRYKQIQNILKKEKRLSTGKIHGILGIDGKYCLSLLHDMLTLDIIQQEKETNATYWKLK